MPQTLLVEMSVDRCADAMKRSTRLFTQHQGAESLIAESKPSLDDLLAKKAAHKAAADEMDAAGDLLVYNTEFLKNQLRSAADACKSFDRDNPGSQIRSVIFPDNTTELLKTDPMEIPDAFRKISSKFETLGTDHALFVNASKLTEKIDKCVSSIAKYKEAATALSLAEAQLEMSKANLVKQYNNNILKAQQMLDKVVAENLFPKIRVIKNSKTAKKEDPKPQPSTPVEIK